MTFNKLCSLVKSALDDIGPASLDDIYMHDLVPDKGTAGFDNGYIAFNAALGHLVDCGDVVLYDGRYATSATDADYQEYLGGLEGCDPSYGMHAVDGELDDKTHDVINHPDHYAAGRQFETVVVIEDWGLGYHLGNAVKYISRAGRKGDPVEDLHKAVWYINRHIANIQSGKV